MTEREEKDVRSYCAWIHQEFGYQLSPDNPIVPTMYIFHKEMQSNVQANRAIATEIKESTSRIEPNVFNFNVSGEALKFQIGIAVKWILFSVPVSVVIWIAAWWWSMANDIDQARIIIESADNIGVLASRIQKGDNGYFFIDFAPSGKDSTRPYTEFQLVDKKTLRVFLGKRTMKRND